MGTGGPTLAASRRQFLRDSYLGLGGLALLVQGHHGVIARWQIRYGDFHHPCVGSFRFGPQRR